MKRSVAVFGLLASSCVTDLGHLRGPLDASLVARARELAPFAPAVVLSERTFTQHDLTRWGKTLYEYRCSILINNAAGFGYAGVHIPYPSHGRVVAIEATIHLPDGRELEVEESQIFDHEVLRTAGDDPVVVRASSFSFPGVVPGAVIDYRYAIVFDGLATRFREEPMPGIPVLSSRREVRLADRLSFVFDQSGFEQRINQRQGELVHVVWELPRPHLPPPVEPYQDGSGHRLAWVSARTLGTELWATDGVVSIYAAQQLDWKRVSRTLRSWFSDDDPRTLPPLTATSSSARDRIAAALRFAQDTIDPRPSLNVDDHPSLAQVLSRGYGSSWDVVRVLRALLDREGFDVRMVLVPTRDMKDPDPDHPSLEILNGAPLIWIEAEGRSIWLDVFCTSCAVGQFSGEYQGRWALAVHQEHRGQSHVELVTVPWQWAPGGELEHHLAVTIAGGRMQVERGQIQLRGQVAAEGRQIIEEYRLQGPALERAVRRMAGLDRESGIVKLTNQADRDSVLRIEVEGAALAKANFVSTPEGVWFSLADVFPVRALEGFAADRATPLRFEQRPDFRRVVSFESKEGLAPRQRPEGAKIESEFGTYALEVKVEGSRLAVVESFVLREPEISLSLYPKFLEFSDRVLAARRAPISFER